MTTRVLPLTAPTVAGGSDYVNAGALDSAIGQIIDKINELLAALTAYGADNELVAGAVDWRTMLATLQEQFADMVGYLATLYQRVPVRWVNWQTEDGVDYTDLGGGWFDGLPTTLALWSVVLPGDPAATYLMRLHLRGMLSSAATMQVRVDSDVRTIAMTDAPLDEVVAFMVRGGSTLTVGLTPGFRFTSQTFEPADNGFVYHPRYRGIGFQFDWLCFEPIEDGAATSVGNQPLLALDGTTLIGWI